jgi:hypothetical protein
MKKIESWKVVAIMLGALVVVMGLSGLRPACAQSMKPGYPDPDATSEMGQLYYQVIGKDVPIPTTGQEAEDFASWLIGRYETYSILGYVGAHHFIRLAAYTRTDSVRAYLLNEANSGPRSNYPEHRRAHSFKGILQALGRLGDPALVPIAIDAYERFGEDEGIAIAAVNAVSWNVAGMPPSAHKKQRTGGMAVARAASSAEETLAADWLARIEGSEDTLPAVKRRAYLELGRVAP